MSYFTFINGETPLNETNLKAMQVGLMELVFPVGSTYITQTDVNPSTILEFGTWERVKGKVLVGLDENDTDFNEIGKTGGEKTHTLSVEEMPHHAHTTGILTDSGISADVGTSSATVVYDQTRGAYTSFAGSSQPHNNLQPYEVIGYMWKRTA